MTSPSTSTGSAPCAEAADARFLGTDLGGTAVFSGITYATAGRFEPPVAARHRGTVVADRPAAQCPQFLGILERAMGAADIPMSEDCLALNVFTPGCDDGRRPVLVWIHGGAFIAGTGSMPWYDGRSLARRGDVVVVTINYRLGVFGFLGTSNLGTLDQLSALEWVRDNIAAFGGDPANITVFGESAGGASLIALMALPAAAACIRRAWAMSPAIVQLRSAERARSAEDRFLGAVGAASRDQLLAMTPDELVRAQQTIFDEVPDGVTAFAPAVDGDLFDETITVLAARSSIPLVIGSTRDEMHLFTSFDPAVANLDDAGLAAAYAERFGERAPAALDAYRAHRPAAGNGALVSAMRTDETFRVGIRRCAEATAAHGTDVWSYWFTQASTAFGGVLGSCHGIDIPFAFHNLDQPGVPVFLGDDPTHARVADAFSGALLSFARDGDPGWARFDMADRSTMRFDASPEVIDDPESELRRLWDAAD